MTPFLLSFGKDKKPAVNMSKNFEGYIGNRFERFGNFVIRHHRSIVALSVVLTIFCGIGLFFIEPAFDVERTMGRKVPYVNKFFNLCKTELGSMYAYDLMITLPHDNDAKKPENLQKLDQLSKIADGYKLTKRHYSITDIVKDMNCTAIVRSVAFLDHPFPFFRFSKVGNAHEVNTSVRTNVEGVNTKP